MRGLQTIEAIMNTLDHTDIAIIYAMADNRMRPTLAAQNAHYNKRTVYGRLNTIRLKTGIDPRDFWGLHRLISIVEAGRGKGVG